MATYDLGTVSTLPVAPKQRDNYTLNDADPTDVFSFELNDFGSINIGMKSLSGNTNLKLFKDTNDNGELDASDQLLATGKDNSMFGSGDEGINFMLPKESI